jgi:membrane-bound metal-dependent hydrolase YbcI (DUF457 family)
MKGPTHELVGVVTAVVGATEVGVPPLGVAIVVAGAYVSSRWPDRFESLFGLPHREQTHYGLTGLVFSSVVVSAALLAASLVAVAVAVGLATGYVMHLVADSMTPDGTRALWPFVTAKVHLLPAGWRITTGSGAERVFFWLLAGVLVYFVASSYGLLELVPR